MYQKTLYIPNPTNKAYWGNTIKNNILRHKLFCCAIIFLSVYIAQLTISWAQTTQQPPETQMLNQEIRYYIPEADTIYLVWGVNGWKLVPETSQSEGTKIIDRLMYTPMTRMADTFVATVKVPADTTIDYVFKVCKVLNGKAHIIWDTYGGPGIDYHTIAEPNGIAMVNATPTTRREIVIEGPNRQMLWPGIILSLSSIAVIFWVVLVGHQTTSIGKRVNFGIYLWQFVSQKWLFLILLSVAGLYIASINLDIYLWADNAHYIIVGKSIATWQGFRDINYPSCPLFTYPVPLFPLFLSPIIYLFGYNLLPLKLAIVMLSVGVIYLIYPIFKELLNKTFLFLLIVLVAVSPQIVSFSHQVMSEMLFLFLVLLSFLFSQKYFGEKDRWFTKNGCITALVITGTLLTRTVGVAFLLASCMYLILNAPINKRLAMRKAAFLLAISISIWTVFNYHILRHLTYVDEIVGSSAAISANSVSAMDIKELAMRIKSNGTAYLKVLPETILYQTSKTPLTIAVVLSILLVGSGFVYGFFKQRTIFEYFIIFYLAILLLYKPISMNWGNYQRYFVPLIPFIFYYFILGLSQTCIRISKLVNFAKNYIKPLHSLPFKLSAFPGQQAIVIFILCLLILFNLSATIQASVFKNKPEMFDYYGYNNGWKQYCYMAQWTKDNISPHSVVMVRNSYLFHFWSEKLTAVYPYIHDQASKNEIIQTITDTKATHIALDTLSHMYISSSDQAIRNVVEQNKQTFKLVYQDGANKFYSILSQLHPTSK